MEPRLAEAKAGKRAVFFVDAAHFVLAPFLGFLWSVVRVFIQAPAGRQRFNVSGALNAITHELITVVNDTYITAESLCELLQKLADLELTIPITLFLDNAPSTHKTALDSLLTLKFQRFQKAQFVPVWGISSLLR